MIPTFSPQGDGNSSGMEAWRLLRSAPKLIPTFSPQGDGNHRPGVAARPVLGGVDPYLFPARGRKPEEYISEVHKLAFVDPYLFPARGRKLVRVFPVPSNTKLIPTFSPQGDGNTNKGSGDLHSQLLPLIPTFSPQGDGNFNILPATGCDHDSVDPYLFPARGRKHYTELFPTQFGLP